MGSTAFIDPVEMLEISLFSATGLSCTSTGEDSENEPETNSSQSEVFILSLDLFDTASLGETVSVENKEEGGRERMMNAKWPWRKGRSLLGGWTSL